MPRQSRLVLPGIAVHIVQRGNNRQQCFFRESDFSLYLLYLRELTKKHDCKIHAYCLMSNHVHLLMTPTAPDGPSALMRDLGQRYVQYINRTRGRTGTLWEGRFRSCVTESARYVLACYRYIELNPVRAGMVEEPGKYAWSSFRANASGEDDRLTTPHAEFTALGLDNASRRDAYNTFFNEALEESLLHVIREATRGDYPLGSEAFLRGHRFPSARKTKRGRAGRPALRVKSEDDRNPEIGL